MDRCEYTSLVDAMSDVPDPRKRRGQRYPWRLLLTLIAAAMASGQQHGRGIGQWVREHGERVTEQLGGSRDRIPSEATLRRTLAAVDVAHLEARLRQIRHAPAVPAAGGWQGLALDGKEVRGSRAHGRIVHLLAVARHDGVVVAQTQVGCKTNEISAAPGLLAGCDLRGTVVTMDALLTQRALAQQITAQGGH